MEETESENKKITIEHDYNYKNIIAYIVAYVLFLSIGIAIYYDHILYGTLDCTISLLSVDSILTIVSTIASATFAFLANRTFTEYKLTQQDCKQLKMVSLKFYINLVVLSIILILLNIFFYAFNFRISLITSTCISVLYLLIFVIPITVSFATEKKHFFTIARTRMSQLIRDIDSTEKFYDCFFLEDAGEDSPTMVLNKFINTLVLKYGVEETIDGLCKGTTVYGTDYLIKEDDAFIYVVYLQNYYLDRILEGQNGDDILNEKTINQYVKNLSLICSKSMLNCVSNFQDNLKDQMLSKLVTSFASLDRIIEQSNSSTLLENGFYHIMYDLLVMAFSIPDQNQNSTDKNIYNGIEDFDSFCFSLINSIFFGSLADSSPWFLRSLFYSINESIFSQTGQDFYYYLFFILLFTISTLIFEKDEITKEEKDVFIKVLKEDFLNYLKDIVNYDNSTYYKKLNNFNKKIESSLKKYSFYTDKDFIDIFDETQRSNEYLALLFFHRNRNQFDRFISGNEAECEDIFKIVTLLSDSESDKIIKFHDCLVEIGVLEQENNFAEGMDELYDYISKYYSRKQIINSVSRKICAKDFANKMNKYFKNMSGYIPKKKDMNPRKMTITFLADKDEKMNLTDDNTFFNPNHVVRRTFEREENPYGHINRINKFSQEDIKNIIQFNPTSKSAPKFDSCFASSDNPAIKNILHLRNDYEFLYPNDNYQVFYRDNPVQFYVQLTSIENIRLILPEDLKEPNLRLYDKSYKHALNKLNLESDCPSDTIFEKVASKYVLVTIRFEYDIVSYPEDRRLVYELSPKQSLVEYIKSVK